MCPLHADSIPPSLFGLNHSNRKGKDLWGKNQFNSTFPISLACYMQSQGHKIIYVKLVDDEKIVNEEIDVGEALGNSPEADPSTFFYDFESTYAPYDALSVNNIGKIDVVVKKITNETTTPLRPLEIKLTVVPDITTAKRRKELWGPELVLRPASTSYAVLGIILSIKCAGKSTEVKELLRSACNNVLDWKNSSRVLSQKDSLLECIGCFQKTYFNYQKPYLLQPIWRTKGQSPELEENAFDVFIWSDMALCQLFIDRAKLFATDNGAISRQLREVFRYCKALYDGVTVDQINVDSIYRDLSYGIDSGQTDKAFSSPGQNTINYLTSDRLKNPIVKSSKLSEIILNNGVEMLKPERRLDQSIFFAMKAAKLQQSR